VIAVFVCLAVLAVFNAAGAVLLRTRGFGLITFQRAAPASRWRAPVARLCGPLGLYVFTCALSTVYIRNVEVPTSKIEVVPGFPAEAAGLRTGDRVVQVAGAEVGSFPDIAERIAGQDRRAPVEVVVLRGDDRVTAAVALDAGGHLGVRPSSEQREHTWGEAIGAALRRPFTVMAAYPRILRALLGARDDRVLVSPFGQSRALVLLGAFAVNVELFWGPLTLLTLLTQLVAWIRGELRAPAEAGG